ncbi:ethanolamine ammonia-lyase subunit EutC [Paracidovorax valerianellae]|uniref:Ethanolamine ammonia-lyase small subunit n=1 Tax=Paracidovorax valerianellae TaxID=187868 RepID=A0A1G6Q8U1_9BURK|nr:ethanolamine ammonia-lyase subunit EutC [Paracidovorax valerianellae]MDA8444432.1 ethanolamine ammonia-lyase subunit EutC [Paracidovorax valerianellae]SDC88932.1 Ethanolamine ammonia-lyase light chain [Paracidovorax valerianellae]
MPRTPSTAATTDTGPAPDPWDDLRTHTAARLALGRAGHAIPTRELLDFGLAHAQARDAVHRPLDVDALATQLQAAGCTTQQVASAAPDRATYLLRPDLGRRLCDADAERLRNAAPDGTAQAGADLLLVVADGLSSLAVERNAVPLIQAVLGTAPQGWRIGPVVIATQARVALGDEVATLLGAHMVAVLVGERPGLSSPDSLGIYLTWHPQVGCSDAQRNCISNVRPEGLVPAAAAARLWWLCGEARRLGLTGIGLKDRSDAAVLSAGPAAGTLPGD